MNQAQIDALAERERRLREALRATLTAVPVECPGCGKEHTTGHQDSCACDHCAMLAEAQEEKA